MTSADNGSYVRESDMGYQPEMVTHPNDPACPGHDINVVLAERSRELGQCLCIHPFMGVINFAGLGCDWCGQLVTEASMSPETKNIRTAAVRAALGDGTGACTDPDGKRWVRETTRGKNANHL